jgi:hypothetical protein
MKQKKRYIIPLVVIVTILLVACGGSENTNNTGAESQSVPTLVVGGQTYQVSDLQGMPQAEATFQDVTYVGVSVADLLSAVGYDLESLSAVKAVAADGYTINYEPGQLSPANVIVAYAQLDGALSVDDGDFRMVLPDEEGKMNLRMLVELQVVE